MVKLSVHMVNVIDRDGLGTLKLDFWVPGISQKIGLRQVEQGFSSCGFRVPIFPLHTSNKSNKLVKHDIFKKSMKLCS